MKLGFIGTGNMAGAIMGGVIKSNVFKPEEIIGADLFAPGREKVKELYGINVTDSNKEVIEKSEVVIFSVKPQFYADVIQEVKDLVRPEQLIITIAKCMRAAVGQNGQCYRIGGDEFMIILKNKTAEETEEIIRQVRAEIEFADEQSDIPISVAMGYAWTDAEEKNLPELIHCADEKMYKDKKRIKENTSSA